MSTGPMSVEKLEIAFRPGAELWVLPNLEQSDWIAKIDWSCNMQISKSLLHQTQKIDDNLKHIIDECGLPEHKLSSQTQSHLLIASDKHLPNRWLLSLPFLDDNAWTKTVEACWQKLNKPNTRIFLPKQLPINKAKSLLSWTDDFVESFD